MHGFNDFLTHLERSGQLERAHSATSGGQLIYEASSRCVKNGPALLLKTDKSEVPLLINAYASMERLSTAWEQDFDILAFKANMADASGNDLQYAAPGSYHYLTSLYDLPLYKYYENDSGPALSFCCVISEDNGLYNSGIYRIEPKEDGTAIIHCKEDTGLRSLFESKGKGVKVTIANGCSPYLIFTSACSLEHGADELRLAAALGGTEYIETENYPVPSDTNVIIHGTLTGETAEGGSFYNHTGTYTKPAQYPVMKVNSISVLDNGCFQDTVTGKPPMEDVWLGRAAARVHFHRFRSKHRDIEDIWHPIEGVFGGMCFIRSFDRSESILNAITEDKFYGKFRNIFVFDGDTDIRNISEVLWKLSNSVDFVKDRANIILV